jgi:hypothetical protein
VAGDVRHRLEAPVALDVYVGSLTRYYRRDWDNVAQRMAREQGWQYSIVRPSEGAEAPPPAADIRRAVTDWCRGLSAGLEAHGYGPVRWDEADDRPYFTDRPGWDGYTALKVWAAHAEHPDLPLPDEVPESWADDPAWKRSTVREFKSRYRTILEPELWIPTEFPFVFEASTLVSDKTCMGSVLTLQRQLDALHGETAAHLKQTSASQPSGLAAMAALGLDVFRQLAHKACEHRLPMMLDY